MKKNIPEIRHLKDIPDVFGHEIEVCREEILDSFISVLEKNHPSTFLNALSMAHWAILDLLILDDDKKIMYINCVIKNFEAYKDMVYEEEEK